MALVISASCLVSAILLASVAHRFERSMPILEILIGILFVLGLSITGWLLNSRF